MSTSKHFDRTVAFILALGLLLTILFMNGTALGLDSSEHVLGYENRLFDTSKVHTLALVVDDWDAFLENCENEEYVSCTAVIDGESYKNVAIRAKGNTSLSQVKNMDSSRYSFKLEFDHYNKNETYHGLDKLCLNNIIQDNTYMKDYLAYRLMAEFGVDAPLCSYVYITVNGEDWGLYLAVEGVEDSFLKRNYGTEGGYLYKPDSMSMGGGRGNGRDFNMDDILKELFGEDVDVSSLSEEEIRQKLDEARDAMQQGSGGRFPGGASFGRPGGGTENGNGVSQGEQMTLPDSAQSAGPSADAGTPNGMPDGAAVSDAQAEPNSVSEPGAESTDRNRSSGGPRGMGGGPGGGMGSDDVKLKYVDDDPDSYSSIFGNAKTTVTDADQARLIASLKQLSAQDNLADVLEIDEVLRYFVVHNFLVNGDSYTGSMIHNYYLYESDGKLSMIPWDYNLAYGSFQGNDASSAVNDPIDTPLSVGSGDSRPMADWIFASEVYTEQYHELFNGFLDLFDLQTMVRETASMIAPYVEKDPTKFCTYEEFEKGVEAIRLFCTLRSESVRGQLDGTIPSTDDGQSADSSTLIDASALATSDLGTMNNGGNGGPGGNGGGFPGFPGNRTKSDNSDAENAGDESEQSQAEDASSENTDDAQQNSPPQSSSDFPGGGPGAFGDNSSFPSGGSGFPGGESSMGTSATVVSQSTWVTLGVCVAALLAGILIAKRYRI